MAYLTPAEVTTRLTGSPYQAEWEGLTPEQQTYGLTKATRLVNQLMFQGFKVDFEQPDQFPRYVQYGACLETVETPDDILQGLAIESMYQGANKTQDTVLLQVKNNISEEWEADTKVIYNLSAKEGTQYLSLNMKSIEACELIYPYIAKSGGY